jgi:hypothetical protein
MTRFEAPFLERLLCLGAAALALALPLDSLAAPKASELGAEMLLHRAVYDLELSSPRGDGGVVGIDGQFEFAWNDVCDGWTVSQKSKMIIGRANGFDAVFGSNVSSWESKDGKRYRFFVTRERDGEETESIKGVASLHESGGNGTARFTEPESRSVELPKGTMFPTAHSLTLLQAAVEGEGLPFFATMFDGTGEDDGLTGVSATLVAEIPADVASELETPLLEGKPSWRISLAYFGMGRGEAEPNQEQRIRIYGNGVVDSFSIDYGSFAFDATLVELEEIEAPDC